MSGDIVVGTYYPWLDYKWGYSTGVPVKNPITSDVPSFIYPMQTLGVAMLKSGQWPLWNPYILGGMPLLANFQSAPFSPANILYFIFDIATAWSLEIVLQHLLAAVFVFILLRYWKVSVKGSLLSGIIYAFSGFNVIWSQWNGHVLAAAFIPVLIYFTERFFRERKIIFGIGISICLALQIVSGYPQVVFYTVGTLGILWLFRFEKTKTFFATTFFYFIFSILGIGLSAFQILTGAELLKNSQREVEALAFDWSTLPFSKIITFIAPDFYGNHVTGNFWGPQDYTSNTGFVGVVALFLSGIASGIRKRREVYFATCLTLIALILAFPTPPSYLFWKSGIAGLNAAAAHRALVLFNLGIAILAGFGFDNLEGSSRQIRIAKRISASIIAIIIIGFGVYSFVIKSHLVVGQSVFTIASRNLVLPVFIFAIGFIIISLVRKYKNLLIFLSILELFYFGWKFTSFVSKDLIFPRTPVLDFLINKERPFRVTGSHVIPVNMRMPYRLESMEGYDAVYPIRMSQFLAALNGKKSGTSPLGRYALVDNDTSPLLDLVNTKYFIVNNYDKTGKISQEGEIPERFRQSRFEVVFRDKSVSVMESTTALPRAFMVYEWEVEKDQNKILDKLLDARYPISSKIILEEEGPELSGKGRSKVEYLNYLETKSVISVNTDKDGLLFVSDTFFPGWTAKTDGAFSKIYRADFAFRAIYVPAGKHIIEFNYQPESFSKGLKISLASFIILAAIGFYEALKLMVFKKIKL